MKTSSSHTSSLLSNRPASVIDREQSKKLLLSRGMSEWQRNAVRICGNWSEQLSSKGKVYFYNCVTEVSQWQKPNDWTLPDIKDHELVKIINERRCSDGHPIKRSLSSTQSEVNRIRDLTSSPKRQRFGLDVQKNETLSTICEKIDHPALSVTNAHLRHLAHELRESLENILSKTPQITKENVNTHINQTSSRSIEETVEYNRQNYPISTFNREEQTNKLLNERSFRITSTFQNNASKPIIDSKLAAFANLLKCATSSQKIHDTLRSNSIDQGNQNSSQITTSSSTLSNNLPSFTISQSHSPIINNTNESVGCDNLSQGENSSQQVSDLMCHLNSLLNQKNETCGNNKTNCTLDKICPQNPLNQRKTPVSNNDKLFQVNPTTLSPLLHQSNIQNIKPTQTIRNIVSALNHAVNVQRARHSHNLSSGAENKNATNSTASSKSSNEPLHTYNKSPVINSSFSDSKCSCDEKGTLMSDRLIFPPSSDGTSILVSPSCTKTSPIFLKSTACPITGIESDRLCGISSQAPSRNENRLSKVVQIYNTSLIDPNDSKKISPIDTMDIEKQNTSGLVLDNPELQKFVDPSLIVKYQHSVANGLEKEAQFELQNFDRLHSVLYSELSGELKKLRALVEISETKLKIHQKRKEALKDLMDALETRKTLPFLIPSNHGT